MGASPWKLGSCDFIRFSFDTAGQFSYNRSIPPIEKKHRKTGAAACSRRRAVLEIPAAVVGKSNRNEGYALFRYRKAVESIVV